jgi:hypothetical protein
MTCRGKIDLARRHAVLVDEVERCAPEVDNTYLGQALRRMRLPIKVRVNATMAPDFYRLDVRATDLSPFGKFDPVRMVTCSPAEATAFYFRLCESLSPPDALTTSLSGGDTAGASASALSSPSAPFPTVADTAPPTRAVAAGSPPGPAAPILSVAP